MWEEVRRLPDGFLPQLIEYRQYARLKFQYDGLTDGKARQAFRERSDMAALVERITFDLVKASAPAPAPMPPPDKKKKR